MSYRKMRFWSFKETLFQHSIFYDVSSDVFENRARWSSRKTPIRVKGCFLKPGFTANFTCWMLISGRFRNVITDLRSYQSLEIILKVRTLFNVRNIHDWIRINDIRIFYICKGVDLDALSILVCIKENVNRALPNVTSF